MHALGQWHVYVVPILRKQRQEDQEFEANLGYIVKLYPTKQ